jgi:hypothetical protein
MVNEGLRTALAWPRRSHDHIRPACNNAGGGGLEIPNPFVRIVGKFEANAPRKPNTSFKCAD